MLQRAYSEILRVPSHVKNFSCRQCTTCCTNKWNIIIDDSSYEKLYELYQDLGRQFDLYNNISLQSQSKSIRFLPNGNCPFLSDGGLCTIQLEFGSEYLPDVCKIYPRRLFSSPRGMDAALSLSCMTAVKTLSQGPISVEEFTLADFSHTTGITLPKTFKQYHPAKLPFADLHKHYYQLEDSFIAIIQNQEYPLNQRLTAIGQAITALLTQSAAHPLLKDEITTTLQQALRSIHTDCFKQDWAMHLSQLYYVIQQYISDICSGTGHLVARGLSLAVALEKSCRLESAVQIVGSKLPIIDPDEYLAKLNKYYYIAGNDVVSILENYLVNYILNKHFFYQTLPVAYYKMAFLYACVIYFGIGYCSITTQPASKEIMFQAIWDVENIFYDDWLNYQAELALAGHSDLQIIRHGAVLTSI